MACFFGPDGSVSEFYYSPAISVAGVKVELMQLLNFVPDWSVSKFYYSPAISVAGAKIELIQIWVFWPRFVSKRVLL